jgi:hypothetical protein
MRLCLEFAHQRQRHALSERLLVLERHEKLACRA